MEPAEAVGTTPAADGIHDQFHAHRPLTSERRIASTEMILKHIATVEEDRASHGFAVKNRKEQLHPAMEVMPQALIVRLRKEIVRFGIDRQHRSLVEPLELAKPFQRLIFDDCYATFDGVADVSAVILTHRPKLLLFGALQIEDDRLSQGFDDGHRMPHPRCRKERMFSDKKGDNVEAAQKLVKRVLPPASKLIGFWGIGPAISQ